MVESHFICSYAKKNYMYDPFVLPSLEEIQQMERQRLQAIEALEISDHSVKCQKCGMAVTIVGKLTRTKNDRIGMLQRRIKWLQDHHYGKDEDIKVIKQELA